MKNSNNARVNQLIFVEYEKPTKDGHFITVVDSYHNTIGRVMKSFNEDTRKFEYQALDHQGKPLLAKSEKLWELKNYFTHNREELLKSAHERRLEAKAQNKGQASQDMEKNHPGKEFKKESAPKSERSMESKPRAKSEENSREISKQEKQADSSKARMSHYDMDLTNEDAIDDFAERESELDELRENNGRDFNQLDR